jgi:septal ring factor EnvC (AmiA/AmiB activator)
MKKLPLEAELDTLQSKVATLISTLYAARQDNAKLSRRLEKLETENRQLAQKLGLAQNQVNQMLTEWFPEVELSDGGHDGSN